MYRLSFSLAVLIAGLTLLFEGSSVTTGVSAKTRNIINIYMPQVFDYAVLRNRKPVIVFFASQKCILCQRTLGKFEAMAQDEYSEDLYFAKVDIDKFPDLMEELGVTGTTVRSYNKGILTDEVRGLQFPAIKEMFQRVARISRASLRFKNRYQG